MRQVKPTIREMLDEIRDTANVQISAYLRLADMVRKHQIKRKQVEEVLLGVREMDADLPIELRRSVTVLEVCDWSRS